MAGATIKHFVFSRFFPGQDPRYPYDVLDPKFLKIQLTLAKNMLVSLENQTNKDFEIIFIVNRKYFDNPKYEFIFSMLRDSTALPLKFIRGYSASPLIKESLNKYDFVIQSLMDFDDFIFKDAVADIQKKVNECENILAYGYCKGYTYFAGDLSDHYNLWKKSGHIGILNSLILKSASAKRLPLITITKFSHHHFKIKMKEYLEENGTVFFESMFQQNSSTNAYIYFRHQFSHNSLVTSPCDLEMVFNKKKKLTNKDGITKKQMEDEFGFFYDLNSIK